MNLFGSLGPLGRLFGLMLVIAAVLAVTLCIYVAFFADLGRTSVLLRAVLFSVGGLVVLLTFIDLLRKGTDLAMWRRANSLEGKASTMADFLSAGRRKTPKHKLDE